MYILRDTGNTRRKRNQKGTIEKGGNPENMANGIPQRLVRVITSMKNKDEFGGKLRWKYSPKPKCYKCGTLGHYANKFPNQANPREQTSSSRVKKVHMSPKEMIKNYKCALCRKKGHRETQCPKSRAFGDTYNAEKSSSSKEVNCYYSSS